MLLCSRIWQGNPKILNRCSLPLTGMRVVSTVSTEKGVFTVLPEGRGLQLIEIADDVTVDELRACTEAHFHVNLDELKPMRQ